MNQIKINRYLNFLIVLILLIAVLFIGSVAYSLVTTPQTAVKINKL